MTKYLDLSGLTYYHSKVKNLVGTVSGTTKTAAALSAVTYMESTGKAHDSLHADNADHTQSASTSSQADKITTPVNITIGNKKLEFDGTKDIIFTLDDIAATAKRITWSELKALRDASGLTEGVNYRITDYACTTTQADTQSAGHQFDIIVVADDNHTLNENARAALHDGDTYFSSCKLSAWKLKYSLDNDTKRYSWADSTNGKGVIYHMVDEWNNDCPYDFKNIQFKRYVLDKANLVETSIQDNNTVSRITALFNATDNIAITVASTSYYKGDYVSDVYQDADTDSYYVPYGDVNYEGDGPCLLCKIDQTKFSYFYTFSSHTNTSPTDKSLSTSTIHDNKLCIGGASGTMDGIEELSNGLPNTIFLSDENCYGNTFGISCYGNTFGNNCYSNTFGNNCYYNTFGNDCYSNTFGNNCRNNSFGNNCYDNSFGNNCNSNSFGNDCYSNTFGNNCNSNSFVPECYSNTFGNNCYYNTFGDNCYYNTFGNNCNSNSFGNYYRWNAFGDGCQWIKFDVTTGSSSYVQGIQVVNATYDTSSTYLVLKPTPNVNYSQWFGVNSSGKLVTWIPADILPMSDAEVDTSIA